ncbi:ABC transporter ATP-binding protein [Microbulbifer yueqingensis]|uniref:Lipopolysaccharide transport system ATP-binding protein n=1 Tax=Microbulbifer yueqingensis TaxID=658219 RepID=A0A1G9A9T5_9GAMM|nr:ATP-binding cassette domain-containing protein [Microbulbifer yueqingensis]SDK24067.1 lipopolysaccharide transport system ATP-binding protein [Microbulbifer yueqingensis]
MTENILIGKSLSEETQLGVDDKALTKEQVMLKLDSVGVSYPDNRRFSRDKFWALKSVSLDLRKGETLGVLGRNGAGKSTLLKLLAGIIEPDTGTLFRRPGVHTSLLALQLGFIPDLSGRENAIMSCILLGMSRKAARARLESIFKFAEIEDAIDKPVSVYSAGMRARLGFGVAMEADPDILLIDEVLGVGDKDFRVKSKDVILEKIHSDKSVVIVSHDLATVEELCDRAVYIKDGVTVQQGSVDEVVSTYCRDGS